MREVYSIHGECAAGDVAMRSGSPKARIAEGGLKYAGMQARDMLVLMRSGNMWRVGIVRNWEDIVGGLLSGMGTK
jgi:hypothetical protein